MINWIKDIPIFGAIFAAMFERFSKGNGEKANKSTKKLTSFLDSEKSPFKKIKENANFKDKNKFNPKKLETFYKYLDSKKIDYSKESFWEELFTGKTQDEKIKNIFNVLKDTQDNKLNGTLFKNISLESLTKILNNVPKIEEKKEQEEIIKHNTKIKTQIEKAKKEGKQEEVQKLEKQIKYSFDDLLKEGKINIGSEENPKIVNISVSSDNKGLEIGGEKYNISIKYFGERFEKITGSNGNYSIFAKGPNGTIIHKLAIYEIKPILKQLIKNGSVNTTMNVSGYNVNLIIKKA